MADISFEDLIPAPRQPVEAAPTGAGMFDDLIPQQAQGPAPDNFRAPDGNDALGVARTVAGGLIEGIPIAGPVIRRGTEMAAAAAKAATSDLTYDQAMARIDELNRTEKQANPYIDTASQVTGAVAATIPAMAAAPVAFGGGSGPLLYRALASGSTGGLIGGADSAVRHNGDGREVFRGFAYGTMGGLAGNAAGDLIGAGTRSAADAWARYTAAKAAGTTSYAAQHLHQALMRDGMTAEQATARLAELGPQGIIADLGPNLQGQAAALANMPGEGNAVIRDALNTRHGGANARLATGIDETLGPRVVPSEVQRGIQASQDALSPEYTRVMQGARAVDTSELAAALESQAVNLRGRAQRAVRQVRDMLDVPGSPGILDPHPGAMHQTRMAIDGLLKTEADPNAIAALKNARRRLDEQLAASVPGIKPVDAQFHELARQDKALKQGQAALDSGRTAPRPEDVQRTLVEGALPQGQMIGPSAEPFQYRQGMRADIDRILGNNANDVAELNRIIKSEGDWNRAKLASAFGERRANQLFSLLDNELTFAKTREFAIGNSHTAGRTQAIKELTPGQQSFGARQAYEAGGVPGILRSLAMKGADAVTNGMVENSHLAGNAELARVLSGREAEIIQMLSRIRSTSQVPEKLKPIVQALIAGGAQNRR